jgi:aryl-alcohol dehydrogenase-like predicted oxidoreductase
MLALCRGLGIGFVAYSPLGRGFLTGRFASRVDIPPDDYRRNSPRFQEGNFEKNLGLLGLINDMAVRKGCSSTQLALAWVLARGEDIVPIPGTKRRNYLEENCGSLAVTCSADDIASLSLLAPPGAVSGARYPEQMMKSIGR